MSSGSPNMTAYGPWSTWDIDGAVNISTGWAIQGNKSEFALVSMALINSSFTLGA